MNTKPKTNYVIQTVDFHDMKLSAILADGVPVVAIRPICESLGLSWGGQHKRIQRDPALQSCVVMMTMQLPGDTQRREVACIPLDRLNGWLFGVDVARVRAELRERMAWYRAECYDVLARHFGLARPVDELRERLLAVEREEAKSYAVARNCSRGMIRRRSEKPRLKAEIEALRSEVQQRLDFDGAQA